MTDANWVRYSDKVGSTGRREVLFRNLSVVPAIGIQQIDTHSAPLVPGYYVFCSGDSSTSFIGPFDDYAGAEAFVTSLLSPATAPFFPELPA